jgi:tRNA(adenine34) deaminase
MSDQEIMIQAINEARKSSEPIGCAVVITRNGEVVAKAYNQQRKRRDATAHAEILAIREAGKMLGDKNLDDCVIYSTCEPCIMCLSAMIFAKVPKLIYGTSMQKTFPDNMPITLMSGELLSATKHKLEIVGGFMEQECSVLLNTD